MLLGQQYVNWIPLNYVSLTLNLNVMPKKKIVLNATFIVIILLWKYACYIFFSGSLENTLYEDKGAGLKFALLNNDLANQFPVEKVKLLKFLIQCEFSFLITLFRLYLIF